MIHGTLKKHPKKQESMVLNKSIYTFLINFYFFIVFKQLITEKKLMYKKLTLVFGCLLLLVAVNCSDENNLLPENNVTSGNEITDGSVTLRYGGGDLDKNLNFVNTKLSFVNLSEDAGELSNASAQASVTYTPNLSGAIAATGSNWYNINNSETYYIPEGTTFTGGFNFNSAGKIIILGNLGGSNWINVPNNGRVEVGPTGKILSTANFHLNNGGLLYNYGVTNYTTNSVDGTIYNYNELAFKNAISLNSSSTVNNYCKMTFESQTNYLNAKLNNEGYLIFTKGFHINSSGNLNLIPGSYTEVTGGTVSMDGKISNSGSGYARMDFSNASLGYLNATPAVTGSVDLNFTNTNYTIFQGTNNTKITSQVTLNGNTDIAASGCVPQKGVPPCNNSQLQFTLLANVTSPTVNSAILSATSVKMLNGLAYVSYHTNDNLYGSSPYGALRVFNVSDNANPSLISEAIFNKVEFNDVNVDNGILYAVGGDKNGARLVTAPLANGTFNTQDLTLFKDYKLPSSSGKGSIFYNNSLWAVTGATGGGYFKLNPASNYSVSEQVYSTGDRSKYVARNDAYQVFFAVEANGAFVRIANSDGSSPRTYSYSGLAQTVVDGKNTLVLDTEYAYIALSDKGVAKIKLSTGELVSHFVPRNYMVNSAKVFSQTGLTNGVAVNNCYLYLANGTDGVIVLNKNTFNVVGYYKLSASANFIHINNNVAFVGNGQNGLSIIKIN